MEKIKTKLKALCIVTHPDDETIWMGGTILLNKDWEWTIFSLSRKNDLDRMPKFMKVCNFYNTQALIADLDDEHLQPLSAIEVIDKIREYLDSFDYDFIFTHGKNGEYGHIRHIELHKAVNEMISVGKLKCKKVFYFSYKGKNKPGEFCIVDKNATKFIKLSNDIYKKKIYLMRDIYGFNENSFEVKSSRNVEAFDIAKLK